MPSSKWDEPPTRASRCGCIILSHRTHSPTYLFMSLDTHCLSRLIPQ